MIKFGNKRVFEPVHKHFGDHNRQHRLSNDKTEGVFPEGQVRTYDIVQRMLFPWNQPKLFGRKNPPEKSNSDPLSSIRLRKATTVSIRASVKRSTMSGVILLN